MSAGAAAAAAAARRRRLLEEEEEVVMTYAPEDLAHHWEFKIVRANRPVFGNAQTFQRLLADEARAGWMMVEKFDNSRIRFKRPQEARLNDRNLPPDVDPYRVQYGLSPGAFAAVLVVTILGLTFGLLALILTVVR